MRHLVLPSNKGDNLERDLKHNSINKIWTCVFREISICLRFAVRHSIRHVIHRNILTLGFSHKGRIDNRMSSRGGLVHRMRTELLPLRFNIFFSAFSNSIKGIDIFRKIWLIDQEEGYSCIVLCSLEVIRKINLNVYINRGKAGSFPQLSMVWYSLQKDLLHGCRCCPKALNTQRRLFLLHVREEISKPFGLVEWQKIRELGTDLALKLSGRNMSLNQRCHLGNVARVIFYHNKMVSSS